VNDDSTLRKAGWVMFGVGYVIGAVSFIEVRSGHPTVIWTILQNVGAAANVVAVVCLGSFYWRRWREGRTLRRELPNESQLSRFLAARRERRSG
jgi:hypothetical protein